MDVDQIAAEYRAVAGQLDALKAMLLEEIEEAAANLPASHVVVTGRVKEPDSYVKKVLRNGYEDPLGAMGDKVGVRADVLYLDEQQQLVDLLQTRPSLETVKVDRKLERLGVDRLGYVGIHLDVRPRQPVEGLPIEASTCEIQIRTFAQAAWAAASHELTYKSPLRPEIEVERALNRLCALVELFDLEVRRAREAVVTAHGSLVPLLDALEFEFARFAPVPLAYDKVLTREVVLTLAGDLESDGIAVLVDGVRETVASEGDYLRELFTRYEEDARGSLLRQPESLLVLHLLRSEPHRLRSRWERRLPISFLEQIAAVFGHSVPSVD